MRFDPRFLKMPSFMFRYLALSRTLVSLFNLSFLVFSRLALLASIKLMMLKFCPKNSFPKQRKVCALKQQRMSGVHFQK